MAGLNSGLYAKEKFELDTPATQLTLEFIPSATVEPVIFVRERDTLDKATTLMRTHNFSQLPVLRGKGKRPTGIVSWRSVAKALLSNPRAVLDDCIEPVSPVPIDTPLLEVIPTITEKDLVLVVKANQDISGIVTSADLGDVLADIARPYLLVSRCEAALRELVQKCLELGVVSAVDVSDRMMSSDSEFSGDPASLTFGDLLNTLKLDAIWSFATLRTDRATLQGAMGDVVELRNAVMHFRTLTEKHKSVIARVPYVTDEIEALAASIRLPTA